MVQIIAWDNKQAQNQTIVSRSNPRAALDRQTGAYLSRLGFHTGNPRVGFEHTVPVTGAGTYHTVKSAVWNETRGTMGTHRLFSSILPITLQEQRTCQLMCAVHVARWWWWSGAEFRYRGEGFTHLWPIDPSPPLKSQSCRHCCCRS